MRNRAEALTIDKFKSGITEKAWMAQIVQLAKLMGFSVYHPFLSIHSERGFPDLTLVRERLILVELKTEKGKLTLDQERWIEMLRKANVEIYVWRPSDFDEVVRVLGRRQG